MNKKLTAAAILAAMTLAATTSAFAATPEDEIKELKARIAKLEANMTTVEKKQSASKMPNITITGESRIRYQWADESPAVDGTDAFDLRQRLYLGAKINDHVSYTGRLEANFKTGTANKNGETRFNQNYFTVTDFGLDKMLIGRVPAAAGMNMNVGKPGDNDGFILVENLDKVTLTGFVLDEAHDTQFNGIYASGSLSKDVDVAIGFTRGDAPAGLPKAESIDFGVAAKLGKDYTLVGEYVDTNNSGAFADADAWAVQLVKGVTTKKVGTLSTNMTIVDKSKVHTQGYMASYRRVEKNGLWNQAAASPFNSNNDIVSKTDNTKGLYLGYQYVMAKNTILTLEYQDLKAVDTGADKDTIFQSHVQFFF